MILFQCLPYLSNECILIFVHGQKKRLFSSGEWMTVELSNTQPTSEQWVHLWINELRGRMWGRCIRVGSSQKKTQLDAFRLQLQSAAYRDSYGRVWQGPL